MSETSKHISSTLQFFNENSLYALLRNYDSLPSENSSRDIDIIISRREYKRCRTELLNVLTQCGWRILSYLDNGRLITFVTAQIKDNEVNLVQWDLFTDTSIHGVRLLSAEKMLASRQYNGILYHVSKEYEFLDKYLYNRAVGAEYPLKYSDIKRDVKDRDIVKKQLLHIFGCGDTDKLDQMSGLLRAAFWRNMRHSPIATLAGVIYSLILYLAGYFGQSVAPSLTFTGADGAGKSTIIDLITQRLAAVYGKATKTFHFRPTIIANLGEVAHDVGLKREVNRDYSKPHRAAKVSVLSSLLRLGYYTIDYIFGYWLKVKPYCRIIHMIIFDRYFSDIIVDSRRSSIYLNTKFLYCWSRLFIPKMQYNFLITAQTDIILSRKQELSGEEIKRINTKMEYLAKKKGYYLIENNGTAEQAATKILNTIIEAQHNRSMERMR